MGLIYSCSYPGFRIDGRVQGQGSQVMGSYVVRTDDISAVIARMEEEKGPAGRLVYSKELVDRLKEAKFRRIKWFFYCDDREGNTIRVFDGRFLQDCGNLFRNTD